MYSVKKTIHLIAAARPNFMKVAPLYHALKKESWVDPVIIHTSQHYDLNMSDSFFKDLRLPEPQLHLGVGSGTHAEQTGRVMIGYEKVIMEQKPDLVVVVGDVNSTMAVTIAAVKLGVKVAHLEAGLRSFDKTMPEEINRLVTDSLADILWTPSPDADQNLINESIDKIRIKMVGNIMIDSFELLRNKIKNENALAQFSLKPKEFVLVTLHRPSNVDERSKLEKIFELLIETSETCNVLFPMHPRTKKRVKEFGLSEMFNSHKQLIISEPLNYIRFMNLVLNSKFLVTDSGGIQEETTYLGIPCLTLRDNTERPITITQGSNRLVNLLNIDKHIGNILEGNHDVGSVPELWDGHTAKRVVDDIRKYFHIEGK